MKYVIISLFALSLTLSACSTGLIPQNQPNTPPTWSPTPYFPPEVTPTPGTEPLSSKSDADVEARRESLVFTMAQFSPDRNKLIYSYRRDQEVDFKGWYSNPARHSEYSGIWLYDRQSKEQRELFASGSQIPIWLDNQQLVWISSDNKSLQSRNLETGQIKTLYGGTYLSGLSPKDGHVFWLDLANQKKIIRLEISTGEIERFDIPYAAFYEAAIAKLYPLNKDQLLIEQSKSFNQEGTYPFKVATTSPPPVTDTYLVSLTNNQAQPLKGGLDRGGMESLSTSSDGQYLLIQKYQTAEIYTRSGELVHEVQGRASWLNQNQLLIQDKNQQTMLQLPDKQIIYRTSTQSVCRVAQAEPALYLQCDAYFANTGYGYVYSGYGYGQEPGPRQRIYQSENPALNLPLKELDLSLGETGSAELAPPESTQPVRIMSHIAGPEGYAGLYLINDQKQPEEVLKLDNPDKPDFKYLPALYWTSGR